MTDSERAIVQIRAVLRDSRFYDDAVSRIERILADLPTPTAAPAVCEWREDENGTWRTACKRSWFFETGDVAENRVHFCHGCGKPVHAIPYPPPAEEKR